MATYAEGTNIENEMRETSYFKQQTDDEKSPEKKSPEKAYPQEGISI
jgi:hypothetical protein